MCVDRVLASPRITQADPYRRTPPRGGSVTVPSHHSRCTVGLQMPASPSFLLGRHALLWPMVSPHLPATSKRGPHLIESLPDLMPHRPAPPLTGIATGAATRAMGIWLPYFTDGLPA
jgi:hypothetical protein